MARIGWHDDSHSGRIAVMAELLTVIVGAFVLVACVTAIAWTFWGILMLPDLGSEGIRFTWECRGTEIRVCRV